MGYCFLIRILDVGMGYCFLIRILDVGMGWEEIISEMLGWGWGGGFSS
jgi:hypothetical protein